MITQERLKEVLRYVASTGLFKWRTENRAHYIGDTAGSVNGAGYINIHVDGTCYLAHRLAFLYKTGKFPIGQVDHRNLIRNDNRWSNLRRCTSLQNHRNIGMYAHNVSGFKGVHFETRRGQWVAKTKVKKKTVFLGYFETAKLASNAYQDYVKVVHGAFYHAPSK